MRFLAVLLVSLMILVAACRPTMVSYTGCTTYWDASSFPIIVSPDKTFTEDDLVWVHLAAQEWNIQVGAEVFQVMPEELQKPDVHRDGIEFGHAYLNEPFLGYCPVIYSTTLEGMSGRVWRGACLVDREDIPNRAVYLRVIIHELGHAIGFVHDKDINSIMYGEVSGSTKIFLQKHLDTVRKMMNGTYKGKAYSGLVSCF